MARRKPGWPYRDREHGTCIVTKVTSTRITFRRTDGKVITRLLKNARSVQYVPSVSFKLSRSPGDTLTPDASRERMPQ